MSEKIFVFFGLFDAVWLKNQKYVTWFHVEKTKLFGGALYQQQCCELEKPRCILTTCPVDYHLPETVMVIKKMDVVNQDKPD